MGSPENSFIICSRSSDLPCEARKAEVLFAHRRWGKPSLEKIRKRPVRSLELWVFTSPSLTSTHFNLFTQPLLSYPLTLQKRNPDLCLKFYKSREPLVAGIFRGVQKIHQNKISHCHCFWVLPTSWRKGPILKTPHFRHRSLRNWVRTDLDTTYLRNDSPNIGRYQSSC